ncbi:MAG: hypothetical protein VCF24_17495 [Candidatus Latescibacterota bacterium]
MKEATAIDIEGLVKATSVAPPGIARSTRQLAVNVSSSAQRINGKLKDVQERLLI